MPLQLYNSAILTADLPDEGLRAGDIGTIVDEHIVAGVAEKGYSVEFFDMTRTVAVVIVPASSLREPTPADRPSVRVMGEIATYVRRILVPLDDHLLGVTGIFYCGYEPRSQSRGVPERLWRAWRSLRGLAG